MFSVERTARSGGPEERGPDCLRHSVLQLPPDFWKLPLGASNSQGRVSVPTVDAWNTHVFHVPVWEPKPASRSQES